MLTPPSRTHPPPFIWPCSSNALASVATCAACARSCLRICISTYCSLRSRRHLRPLRRPRDHRHCCSLRCRFCIRCRRRRRRLCCLPLSKLCRHVLRKGILQRRSSGNPDLHRGCHLFGNRTQLGMLSSQPLAPVPSCPVTVCAARSPCAASASASEVGCLSSHAPVGGAANAPLVAVSTTSASAWLPLLPLRLREPSGARGAVTSSCSRARWLSVRSAVLPHG